MNIQTKGFVGAEELHYLLQAEWVQLVGTSNGNYEYRFSSPALMKDLGEYLYDLNRMRTEGKRKGGKLLNTFTMLSNDEGKAMMLKAERKGPRSLPYFEKIRADGGGVFRPGSREGGKWFSIFFGRATKAWMLSWIQDMKLEPLRQGVVWHSGGATVWVCVAGEDEVQKLQEHVVLVFEDRPPLIIRMRTTPPGSLEPMEASRPGGEGWTPEMVQAEGAAEPMRFSEVTRKMVGQLRKTKGFTAMHGGGEVDLSPWGGGPENLRTNHSWEGWEAPR